jgi:hypothetical protein
VTRDEWRTIVKTHAEAEARRLYGWCRCFRADKDCAACRYVARRVADAMNEYDDVE